MKDLIELLSLKLSHTTLIVIIKVSIPLIFTLTGIFIKNGYDNINNNINNINKNIESEHRKTMNYINSKFDNHFSLEQRNNEIIYNELKKLSSNDNKENIEQLKILINGLYFTNKSAEIKADTVKKKSWKIDQNLCVNTK